jgi:hypothetical protein
MREENGTSKYQSIIHEVFFDKTIVVLDIEKRFSKIETEEITG